jgi:hypothetical protein
MADEPKVYYPETIEDTPFPGEDFGDDLSTTQQTSNETFGDKTIKSQPFPTRRVAYEVLSSALNTKSRKILSEFEFTQHGSIKIGSYENGTSGDIRITPNGMTARDLSGNTTFNLDGTTGDATFKGSVQAGSVITGIVSVGDNNIVIDGDARRMVFYDENDIPVILIGNA